MDQGAERALAVLAQGLRDARCDSPGGLLRHFGARSGGALLARLGCVGNTAALWEAAAYATAQALLPADEIAALVADWLPHDEALREFGERALLLVADPRAPTLPAEAKGRLVARLSRPAQVAFETYALAREVAARVVAQLQPPTTGRDDYET